jgi:outer membrane immunogenic protein
MRAFVGGVLALALGLSAAASAADLAPYTKAPGPMLAPMWDWSGFYVGINGGGGSSHKCWDFVNAGLLGAEGCHNATGGTVGGQLGYRTQSGNWVFGLEGQANWADFSGQNVSTFIPGQLNRSWVQAFALFTGQVGYAWNNVLFYVKGGGAVVDDRYDIFVAPGFPGAGARLANAVNEARGGGTVGAGLEYSFAPHWSVGIEYDHVFLGNHTTLLTTTPGGSAFQNDRIRQDIDMGLVRVNYVFGGPSIAKY